VTAAADGSKDASRDDREAKKARAREERKNQTRIRAIETKIERLEARRAELDATLETAWAPGADRAVAEAAAAEAARVRNDLETLYEEWTSLES
jgi:predicted RNase H-like nuclease (RuvC/YqgF family)